jgi:hypothetical protein
LRDVYIEADIMATPKPKPRRTKSVKRARADDFWVFENPDKAASVNGATTQALSHPWRHAIVGPPGAGKLQLLINQLMRCPEKPSVTVLHLDANTMEYNGIADRIYDVLADDFTFHNLDEPGAKVVVLDEVPWTRLPKDRLEKLTTLFRYATHKNTSIAMCYQNFAAIPTEIRRACSAFSFFPSCDKNQLGHMASATGVDVTELRQLLGLTRSRREAITIDDNERAKPLHYRLQFIWPVRRISGPKPAAPVDDDVRAGGAVVVVPPVSQLPAPEKPAAELEPEGAAYDGD